MANIGNLAVLVTANADAFSSTLEKAAKYIDKFGQRAARLKGAVVAPIEAIADKFKDLLTAIPVVGQAFSVLPSSASGFISWLREGQKEIVSMSREAKRLNLSFDALVGLQLLAGSSADAMEKGLFKLSRQLGDAVTAGQESKDVFQNLGLDSAALGVLPLDQALGVISDKFLSIHSPAERAYLAFQLFGKAGFELLPVLSRGSAAIADMSAKAQGLGLGASALDVSGVLRAERAFSTLNAAMTGLQRQAAIAFAPLLGAAAEWADKLFANEKGFRDFWQNAATYAATGIAKILEFVDELISQIKQQFAELKGSLSDPTGLKELFGGGGTTPGSIQIPKGKSSVQVAPPIGGPLTGAHGVFADVIEKLRNPQDWIKQAANSIKGFGDDSLAGARNAAELAKAQAKLATSVGELELGLRAQVETFGLGAEAAKIFKLEQEGATVSMLAGARAASDQLDHLKKMDELQKNAGDLFEKARTPLEHFTDQVVGLNEELTAGFITQETFSRQLVNSFEHILDLKDKTSAVKPPSALDFGSSGAISAINQFYAGQRDNSGDVQRRIEQVLRQQTTIEQSQAQDVKRAADTLSRIFVRGI